MRHLSKSLITNKKNTKPEKKSSKKSSGWTIMTTVIMTMTRIEELLYEYVKKAIIQKGLMENMIWFISKPLHKN